MDPDSQVISILRVVLAIGPIALYFLGLGLINSQARPCLVSSRVDFTVLTTACVPVIVWPVVTLVEVGHYGLAGATVGVLGLLFGLLLPRREAGWVIYNISDEQCQAVVRRMCRRQGWRLEPAGVDGSVEAGSREVDGRIEPIGLSLSRHSLPWLRNVTLRVEPTRCPAEGEWPSIRRRFVDALEAELGHESMLPSPAGASLVIAGTTLLGLPMWYLFRHMDAIVEVVRRILFA